MKKQHSKKILQQKTWVLINYYLQQDINQEIKLCLFNYKISSIKRRRTSEQISIDI